ncbi:hypothetical protein D9C73_000068 [Collichthys lucidus]|uniref:Uncharacterized protein n=1 Tax=Collichthys lucidus TaxID=240159 RepID=A0A4V6API6_COLLU|nr:hypothetical protein D9C73_000068 [Collichthys lucidus]
MALQHKHDDASYVFPPPPPPPSYGSISSTIKEKDESSASGGTRSKEVITHKNADSASVPSASSSISEQMLSSSHTRTGVKYQPDLADSTTMVMPQPTNSFHPSLLLPNYNMPMVEYPGPTGPIRVQRGWTAPDMMEAGKQLSSLESGGYRFESILSRLRQRLSGGEGMPPKKRSSKLEGNTNAKRKVRRLEVGWMDYDEDEERYKQVKSANGGGTRHLSVEKDETVADIKVMAENIFFPNGCSKKKIRLSNYSTHMESSQIHINVSNTVDELYNKSKLKMLRLYLCTKMKTGQQPPVGVEDDHTTSQPSEVDLTDQNQAVEYLLVENRNSESTYHHFINDGASTSGNLELDETLPWDGRLDVTEDEPNLETAIPEKEDDAPSETVDQSLSPPVLAGEADVSAQALSEPQSSPVTLIVRRGHCLTDMINAFKDPKIVASEVLCDSTTSSFKDSLLLYVSHEERSILEKALEDFNSVDTDELLDVLDAHECKQVPTEDTLLPVLSQIGHKVIIQAPMYVIKCWRPVLVSVASLLPPEGLHHFIAQKKTTAKNSEGASKVSRGDDSSPINSFALPKEVEADPSSDWAAQLAVGGGELQVEDQHRPHEAPWLQELMKEKIKQTGSKTELG